MARRKNWEVGNVVEIPLADGSYSYGVVVPPMLMAFSSVNYLEKQEISLQLFSDIGFIIGVMKYAIGKKHWTVVGRVEISSDFSDELTFYKYDTIAKKFKHCDASYNEKGEVSYEMCLGLECAAGWDPEHVESRLLDAKNGIPNIWVESLKAEGHLQD